jgi:putative Mn2+ efflux pump MntP
MSPGAIAILSLAMSTDAFAAAVGRGASTRPSMLGALKAGLVFGVIEAITPLIGWAFGLLAASFVRDVDHWIAFTLLTIVGGRMIWEVSRTGDHTDDGLARRTGALALIATAIGTSIDAAAVGVGLAFIGANILIIAAAIGFSTLVCATTGLLIGKVVGQAFGKVAELLGGIALITIGTAILLEHLGAFPG